MSISIDNDQLPIVENEIGPIEGGSPERISNDNESHRDARLHSIRILYFLIGISQLLPLNFLIMADDLWMYKFREISPNTTEENKKDSKLEDQFNSYLVMACNLPFLIIYFISLTNCFQRISIHLKNCLAFSSAIFTFALITAYVLVDTDQYQLEYLKVLLSLVFILNSSTIILQANFTGAVSLFPAKCVHAMINGQAISGLLAAMLKILSLIANGSIVYNVFSFFVLANIILLATFIFYVYIQQTDCYKSYSSASVSPYISLDLKIFLKIFKLTWPFCMTLTFIFWVTFSVYPSLFVLIVMESLKQETTHHTADRFVLPVTCFLTFNLADFLGRYIGKRLLFAKEKAVQVMCISMGRMLFIPLFMYFYKQSAHLSLQYSALLFIILNFVFALMNGYLVLNVFVKGPLVVPEEYRTITGYLLISFLGLGLTLGSLTSPLVLDLV